MLSNPTKTLTAASVSNRPPKPDSSPIDALSLLIPTTVVGLVLRSVFDPVRWPMMLTGLRTLTTPPMLCHIVGPRSKMLSDAARATDSLFHLTSVPDDTPRNALPNASGDGLEASTTSLVSVEPSRCNSSVTVSPG